MMLELLWLQWEACKFGLLFLSLAVSCYLVSMPGVFCHVCIALILLEIVNAAIE